MTLLEAATAFLDQCDEIHRHPERRQFPNPVLVENLRAAIEREAQPHVHEWSLSNVFPEDEQSHSPVSAMDHQVRTNQMAVQSCVCGEMKRVLVSYGPWRWLNRRSSDD